MITIRRYFLFSALFLFAFHLHSYGCPGVTSTVSSSVKVVSEERIDRQKTSLKRFPINLANNTAALFSHANLSPLMIGAAATGISSTIDDDLHDYFEKRNTDGNAENIGATLGKPYVVTPTVVGLLVAGHYSKNEKFRSFSYALSQGFVLNYALTMSLKLAAGRERPDGSNDQSFPSGHASDSFMIATVLHEYYGHRTGIIAYGVSSFIAASRVKKDVHWLSDVVGGATIGYIVGRTVSHYTGGTARERRFAFFPTVDPIGKRYGLTFTARLP